MCLQSLRRDRSGGLATKSITQNFVYPQTFLSDSINQSATVFLDNETITGTFNFTDEYLQRSNNVTDRLDVIWPYPAVHVTYCPSVTGSFRPAYRGYYSGWVGLARGGF